MSQSLLRGLDVLGLMGDGGGETTVTQAARALGVSASTTSRLLASLESRGFVWQDPDTLRYRLGTRLLRLGNVLLDNLNLGALGHDVVRTLGRSTDEAAHLAVLVGTDAVFVDRTEGPAGGLTITNEIGAHDPTYCTAIGRALLSGLSDPEVRERLRETPFVRYTPRTISTMEQLLERLHEVRRLGYAYDEEEKNQGVSCLAAPVFDHAGRVVAAVGISGPTPRFIQSGHQKLASVVVGAGRTLSRRLGHEGPDAEPQVSASG